MSFEGKMRRMAPVAAALVGLESAPAFAREAGGAPMENREIRVEEVERRPEGAEVQRSLDLIIALNEKSRWNAEVADAVDVGYGKAQRKPLFSGERTIRSGENDLSLAGLDCTASFVEVDATSDGNYAGTLAYLRADCSPTGFPDQHKEATVFIYGNSTSEDTFATDLTRVIPWSMPLVKSLLVDVHGADFAGDDARYQAVNHQLTQLGGDLFVLQALQQMAGGDSYAAERIVSRVKITLRNLERTGVEINREKADAVLGAR
ncbi:MAG: hypothetical protein AAB839_00885 [Patescibacteria group bacterium]